MKSSRKGLWNTIAQIGLPFFTISGFLLTSIKIPEWGVVASLTAQIFWLYSSYRAWKEAGQIGIFINTIAVIIILSYGVINYWIFS